MGEIRIGRLTLGMYQTNCYLVYREGENKAIIFDPADEGGLIFDKLSEKGFEVSAIVLTHGHFDHIFGVSELKSKAHCKVYALDKEKELLESSHINCSESVHRPVMVVADVFFRDKEEVTIENITFTVLSTPGHTEGSACYYFKEAGILVSGDTLFSESVGRSDLPTGSGKKLIESINEKLMELPDNTRVYPGHGGTTTIGNERENNPFIN